MAENDMADEIDGDSGPRQVQIVALLERIGQLFASKTVQALDPEVIRDAIDKIGPILLKLSQEREFRDHSKKTVKLGALEKFNPSPAKEKQLARLFSGDGQRTKKIEVATGIVDFFRSNGRSIFSLDEALTVVREMGFETILGHTDDLQLRIVVGDLFGKNCMNLQQIKSSGSQKSYVVP